jgi:hypothetical protein
MVSPAEAAATAAPMVDLQGNPWVGLPAGLTQSVAAEAVMEPMSKVHPKRNARWGKFDRYDNER